MECVFPPGEFPEPDRLIPPNMLLNISNHVIHSRVKFRSEFSDT